MSSSPARARPAAYGWVVGVLVLVALVVAWRGLGEERRFAEVLQNAEPAWLLATAALQIATYLCLARAWSIAIARGGGVPPRTWSLVRLALAELFTDQALPSGGIGGTVLVVRALGRRGVPTAAAGTAVVASLLGLYAAQLVIVAASVVELFARRRFGSFAGGVSIFAFLAAAGLPVVTVSLAAGGLQRLPARIQRLRVVQALREAIDAAPRDVLFAPRTMLPISAMRLVIVVLDGATLAAALAAVGYPIPVDEAVTTFALASVAASVSFLPGGIGGFEAIATGLLATYGVPIEAAVPAILIMRGFSFWLPMLPGVWFARHEIGGPLRSVGQAGGG